MQRASVDLGIAGVAVGACEHEFAARAVANDATRAADIAIEDEGAAIGAVEGRVRIQHERRVDVVGQQICSCARTTGEVHGGQRGTIVDELEGAAADGRGGRARAVRACQREIVHLEDTRDVIRGRSGDCGECLASEELHGGSA